MRWPGRKKTEPSIPPAPEVEDRSEDAHKMLELAERRDRVGKRLTRQTQHAIAQNHFAPNIKRAMES